MNSRLGQQLGQYRLIRLLGQGGFAEVYLGEHIYLKTQAALKVSQVRVANEDMESFLQEARTIASLKHSHIVRVLDFGVENNIPYLVMEYAPLGSIRQQYPKGTRLPLDIVVAYVKQAASALQYAHQQRLVHRDVKPENMLLESPEHILLSDFGIALVAQSSRYQQTEETIGTVAYMAPEQLQGRPRPASDQYALGIVVYEWLCGDRPFHGSFTEMYSQHLFVPPPSLVEKVSGLPASVEVAIQTALAKDPQQRFRSVQDFADALEWAALQGQPTFVPSYLQKPLSSQPFVVSQQPEHSTEKTVEAMPQQPTISSFRRRGKIVTRRTILMGGLGLVAIGD